MIIARLIPGFFVMLESAHIGSSSWTYAQTKSQVNFPVLDHLNVKSIADRSCRSKCLEGDKQIIEALTSCLDHRRRPSVNLTQNQHPQRSRSPANLLIK